MIEPGQKREYIVDYRYSVQYVVEARPAGGTTYIVRWWVSPAAGSLTDSLKT